MPESSFRDPAKGGKTLLRGPEMKIPAYRGEQEFEVTPERVEQWAKDGWVDLRPQNIKIWQDRIRKIFEEINSIPEDDTSSQYERDRQYWLEDEAIHIGKVVGWIFSHEEKGLRMKD
ncbi:MAG: hypothetical protein D6813_10400 [Calditrichaeota bacterium]|nr:MAG: hypothetical protein D6813_10400 [Calditrichota bacterium]